MPPGFEGMGGMGGMPGMGGMGGGGGGRPKGDNTKFYKLLDVEPDADEGQLKKVRASNVPALIGCVPRCTCRGRWLLPALASMQSGPRVALGSDGVQI